MDLVERIGRMIEPTLEDMGYELVRVMLSGQQRRTLQIMAERKDGGMTVEDCAEISRAVSALLDVDDPIEGAYTLEVSSPGIDRPLVRERDFERFAGHLAKVEMDTAVDGQRRFTGTLLGIADGEVQLVLEDGTRIGLPHAGIRKAKLVLTDDLIAAAEAEQDAGPPGD